MRSSKAAATLRDDFPAYEAEFAQDDSREPIGSFNEYVEAVLHGARPDLRKLLRDPGTAKVYQKYLDLKLSGPRAKEAPFPVVAVDRRG